MATKNEMGMRITINRLLLLSESFIGRKFKDQLHQFSTKQWTQDYQTRNTSNKALMNCDVAPKKTRRKYVTHWANLPDILLERIFSHLTIRERFYASLVCKTWNRAFYLPNVWSRFVLEDTTLTRARFNYYQGWQVSKMMIYVVFKLNFGLFSMF